MRRPVALLLAVALSGCNLPINAPVVLPTPSPVQHVPVCQAPVLVANCYVQPPGEGWSWLCADGIEKVASPAGCSAAPPPAACVIPDGVEGRDIHRVLPQPAGDPKAAAELRTAIRTLRSCPDGDSPRCLVGVTLDQWRAELVAQLKRQGVCAGLQGGSDEVCVLVAPGVCQGWRAGTCAGADPLHGCEHDVVVAWPTAGAVRDTWAVGPGGAPATPPPAAETTCDADAPEATGYRWYQGAMSNPQLKMVCAIAITNSPEWCKPRFEDYRQWGVCSYYPEGNPKRDDCLRTKGRPTFTGPIDVRADNVICGNVEVGATITACAPSGACGSYTVTP